MVTMSIKATPLTGEDCREWPSMAYWGYREAIFLSMGLSPKYRSHEIGEDEAEKLGIEFLNRGDKIERSQHALKLEDKFPVTLIPRKDDRGYPEELVGTHEIVCRPAPFTKWAIMNFPSFPEELFKAVKDRYPAEFLEFEWPGKSSPMKKSVKAEQTQSAGREPKALIDHRWSPKREMEAKARQFAREELERGCNCSHADLADFMNTQAFDASEQLLFNHPKITEKSMPNLLKNAVREVFEECAPNRIVGTPVYRKPDELCPIHPK
ncbi:hypothetical protein [Geoanaerobacter pelophilus]|uniref:hypothetical protein n=1 Tax=Geoanaerobacter pelophilus TaxID=60036 RepID=UPI000A267AEA|nr:hypothetical protein [Geoanaerobacter pelophilus]